MKKLFTIIGPIYMTIVTIAISTITAFSQVDKSGYIPPACAGKPLTKMSREAMLALAPISTSIKPNQPISITDQHDVFDSLVYAINNNYLYADFKNLDWPGLVTEFRAKIDSGLDTEKFYMRMGEFIRRLGDKHSSFQSPSTVEAAQTRLVSENNKYVGIGTYIMAMLEKKCVVILAVSPGSPAEYSGLKQHDIITMVDSLPMIVNDKLYPLTRGPECSEATLTVKSPGKDFRYVNVVRASVPSGAPISARLVPDANGRRIGYIFLPTFLEITVVERVKKALEDFGQLDGLILDNRMNTGGSSRVLFPLLSYFTSGTVGHFVSRKEKRPLAVVPNPINNSQQVPLVILVSKGTVSYAEVFAGVLQDNGRAKVVGQNSAGRVETLHSFNFKDGSRAWLAKESFDPAISHAIWQGRGITPDVEAYAEWDEFTFETDPGLKAALKLFPKR